MSNKTTMRLPEDLCGFSIRGVQLDVTDGTVEVPGDLVAEAAEAGLVVVSSPAGKSNEELEAEYAAAEADKEQAAKDAAQAEADAAAEAEKAKTPVVGDKVSFTDGDNTIEGVVKEIRPGKKGVIAVDVEVTLPDTDPEVWEVAMADLTKVAGE